MEKRRLPVGIQTFRRVREEGYYYVDKTAHARRIAEDAGTHYFLSRPRRFGKSLFVDTLKELYEGSEPLFRGLAIRAWYNGYNWRGEERVYNPWAILHLFASREFKSHWFETATPRFLVDTLLRRGFSGPDLEGLHADDDLLSAFDVASAATEALLFQTGYLSC